MRQLTLVEPHRLEWWDVDDPQRRDGRDALVRPLAVATCDLDAPIIAGHTPYKPPIAIGHECVAEVVEAADGGPEPGTIVSVPFQLSCGACERCRRGLTGNCESVPFLRCTGLAHSAAMGGFLSDIVRVPFADHMLSPLPEGVAPEAAASVSDNIVDGWRLVAPGLEQWPAGEVLIVGGSPSVGLYGVQAALALGAARVVYCDVEGERLGKAEHLGAEPVEGYPERLGPFPITAMVAAEAAALGLALRSTAPDGICTSAGIVLPTRDTDPADGDVHEDHQLPDGPTARAPHDSASARVDGAGEAATRARHRPRRGVGRGAGGPRGQSREARLQPSRLSLAHRRRPQGFTSD